MPRPLRFIPQGGSLVEVTVRTFQARFLLRPSSALNEVVGGVLGRAQRLYPLECHAAVFMSNHFHLLVSVDNSLRLAEFMQYVNSNLAREINRLYEWESSVWDERYHAILVSSEEEAQAARLRYLLAHGVKEGLVAKASDWPGVHSVREILQGAPIQGLWFDRTAEFVARSRGESFDRLKYAAAEKLELSPLPCWSHLSPEDYRGRVAELVGELEAVAVSDLQARGLAPLGLTGVLRQDPHGRPHWTKRTPAPLFHAATRAVRQAFRRVYMDFVAAFRSAAKALRLGDRMARFPVGAFPPGLPFVAVDPPGPP